MTPQAASPLRRHLPALAVALVLLAIALSNALWLAADRRPPDWDQSRYILMTRDIANRMADLDPSLLRLALERAWDEHHDVFAVTLR